MKENPLISDEILIRAKEFLDRMRVKYDGDVILLDKGGNSMVMNPNSPFPEFLGFSINRVAEAVARKLGKKIEWVNEEW